MFTVGDVLAFKYRRLILRGILINPFEKTVKEVEVPGDEHLSEWYKLLGCECICSVRLDGNNVLWLDDNGLLGDQKNQRHFFLGKYPQMLAGKGLILAVNARGESVSTTLNVGLVYSNVVWVKPELVPALMPPTEPTIYELDENLKIKRGLSGPWANEDKEQS